MSQQDVEDAVKFAIEDIRDSVDILDTDEEYIHALWKICSWCSDQMVARREQICNAGGRGQ